MFDCFFWVPEIPLNQLAIDDALLERERAAGRIVSIDGFLPTMMAGLRLSLLAGNGPGIEEDEDVLAR